MAASSPCEEGERDEARLQGRGQRGVAFVLNGYEDVSVY